MPGTLSLITVMLVPQTKYYFASAVNCGHPPYVPNSITRGSKFTFGQKVDYYCLLGYRPRGNLTRVCLSSGNWSNDNFTCIGIKYMFFIIVVNLPL